MSSNNSFNLPLGDNQVILGKTGLVPEAATITPGTNMSIVATPGALTFNSVNLLAGSNVTLTPGVGSLTINSTAVASSMWTRVDQTFSPGTPPTNQMTMVANRFYNVGNNTTGFNIQLVLPEFASIGDYFLVATHNPNGPNVSVLAPVAPYTITITYLGSSFQNATFANNQSNFLWIMCTGFVAGFNKYQVLSKTDGVILS